MPEAVERLSGETVLVVGPAECAGERRDGLHAALHRAKRSIAVLTADAGAESDEEPLPEISGEFDEVFDVGFDPRGGSIPYRSVLESPTRREREIISSAKGPGGRAIPWAVAGSQTPGNLALVSGLVERLTPGGFVYAPEPEMFERSPRPLSEPRELDAVLCKTDYYVWSSGVSHYESHGFSRAVVNGAVPCRVSGQAPVGGAPGQFESVEDLCAALQSRGPRRMYEQARDFYLSRGTLGEHLKNALEEG